MVRTGAVGVVAAAAGIVAALMTAPASAAAGAPAPTVSYFVASSDLLAGFGRGPHSYFYSSATGDQFHLAGSSAYVDVGITGADGHEYDVSLDAGRRGVLRPGAVLSPAGDGQPASFRLWSERDGGCSGPVTAQVRDIGFDSDGNATRLDLLWTGCSQPGLNGDRTGARAEVVVNESRQPGIRLMPAAAAWNAAIPGVPQAPTRFIAVNEDTASRAITGIDTATLRRAQFTTGADRCAGRTLAPDESCGVDVTYRPSEAGSTATTLRVAADDGTSTARLSGSRPDGQFVFGSTLAPWPEPVVRPGTTRALFATGGSNAAEIWTSRVNSDGTLGSSTGTGVMLPQGQVLHVGHTYRFNPESASPQSAPTLTCDDTTPTSGTLHISELAVAATGEVRRLAMRWHMTVADFDGTPLTCEGFAAFNAHHVPMIRDLRTPPPVSHFRASIRPRHVTLHWKAPKTAHIVEIRLTTGHHPTGRHRGVLVCEDVSGSTCRWSWRRSPQARRYTFTAYAVTRYGMWSTKRTVTFLRPADD